jgi:hypothetical protein
MGGRSTAAKLAAARRRIRELEAELEKRDHMKPPMPPPYDPDLDAICYIEDPHHGPSRPRSWRCTWLQLTGRKCPHWEEPR